MTARAYRIGLVAILAVVVVLGAVTAQAATLTLAPNGVVSSSGWSANTGTVLSAIAANDGDSTYVTTTGTNALRVGFTDPVQTGNISKVTLRVVACGYKSPGSPFASVQLGMAVGANVAYGSVSAVSSTYQTYEQVLTSRPGGGTWTWTDVQNLEGIVMATFSNSCSVRVTQMQIEVEYTVATPNTVTFSAHSAGNTTGGDVSPGAEVVVARYAMRRTVGDTAGPEIDTVTITNARTNPSTNVSAVYVYRDINGDGALDAGDVKLNSTGALFSGASAVVTIDEAVTDATKQYLVTYVVAAGAADGALMDAKVTAVTTTNISTVSGLPLPASPATFTVARPTLTVTNADHVAAAYTYTRTLATDVPIDNIRFAASDGAVTINKITVHRPDTLAAGSVSLVKIRLDDGDGVYETSEDTLLGSMAYGAGANAAFTGLNVAVADGGHKDVWIAYDVAEICSHAEALGSQVEYGGLAVNSPAVITSFSTLNSVMSGEGVVVDNEAPDSVDCVITQPVDGASTALASGTPYAITGTAADALSGVAWVRVSVKQLSTPATWWDFDSAEWSTGEKWADATNTGTAYSTWDPEFVIPESDGTSFEISALFGDLAGNEFMSTSMLLIDNIKPTVQSVVPVDATHVDVIFSETLDQGSAPDAADFTVNNGLSVSGAAWQDARTVRLTTGTQVVETMYTLTVSAGAVSDVIGNANDLQSADFYGYGSSTDTIPPSIPTGVVAVAGSDPVIATVSWTASTGDPVGYTVLRAMNPAGPFTPIGSTASTSFNDTTGITGQDYYYAVKAYDAAGNISAQSDTAGPVSASWIPSPHGTYTGSSGLCRACHSAHVAAEEGPLFRQTGNLPGELSICYTCHDGALAGNIESGAENSFSEDLLSGHSVEQTETADLTDVCSDCHSPHQDPGTRTSLPAKDVNGVEITAAGNEWCLACHNATADWYEAGGYGTLVTDPSRNATGYPTVGTFPGYLDDANNPHRAIPASTEPTRVAGDCLYCHASHRGPNEFDGLVSTFTSADFTLCFDCHDGTTTGANIKQYYPSDAGGSATQTSGTRFGHRTETAGMLPAGSALPCYDCHNPHGSATPNGLVVFTETASGTSIAVGDGAGELDLGDDAGVREFCFTCHTTCGSSAGNSDPYGWNGSAYAVVSAGAEFEGIDRTVRNDVAKTGLKIPVVAGHYRDDTASCLTCHGTLTASSGVNIHNPGGGVSNGGMACYLCHASYDVMNSSTSSYHHVMDAATPDVAPGSSASYPTSDSALACVSCHTDHNYFTDKGTNLRTNIADNTGTASRTDYSQTAPYGICVSCHDSSQTKSTTGQKVGGSEVTLIIDGSVYANKAHDYAIDNAAKVGYDDGSKFQANCTKCHDDENDTGMFQSGTYKIGLHTSAEDRLAKALGASGTPTEQNLCFVCHTGSSGTDGYGVASMTTESQAVATYFGASYTNTTSPWVVKKHAVGSYTAKHESDETQSDINSNKHIECEDCHNVHKSGATTHTRGTNSIGSTSPLYGVWGQQPTYTAGANWAAPTGYTRVETSTADYQICFKCHSGANTSLSSWGGTGATAWTNVALDFNPNNRSFHPVMAALGSNAIPAAWMDAGWQNVGTQRMMCSDCHGASSGTVEGPHGSAVNHMLKGYWPNDSAGNPYTITGLSGGTQTGILCDLCHNDFANQPAHRARSDHRTVPCYRCHIVVPHGGGLDRLIGDGNSSMPSRYAYNNDKNTNWVSQYENDGALNKSDCSVTTWAASGCFSHDTNTSGMENW